MDLSSQTYLFHFVIAILPEFQLLSPLFLAIVWHQIPKLYDIYAMPAYWQKYEYPWSK